MIYFGLPTNEYYFGDGAIEGLNDLVKKHQVKSVLLTYGGGSIKKIGLYDAIVKILKTHGVKVYEHAGIQPNPLHTHTTQGGLLAREHNVDLIIAVGGGSTVDAAKVMAAVASNKHVKDAWDIVTQKVTLKNDPVPIISIITLAGTASENNAGSVITNADTQEKLVVYTKAPIAAIEDPTYTMSVSPYQTASGIFDCFSHLLEIYFVRSAGDDFEWTNQYIFANLRTLLKFSATAVNDPKNYEARANILMTTSFSLNGLSNFNFKSMDWTVHDLEHALSAVYDVAHGAGLALITPTYMTIKCERDALFKARTARLAKELFNKSTAEDFIKELRSYINDTLKLPNHYQAFEEIAKPLGKSDFAKLSTKVAWTDAKFANEVFSHVPN